MYSDAVWFTDNPMFKYYSSFIYPGELEKTQINTSASYLRLLTTGDTVLFHFLLHDNITNVTFVRRTFSSSSVYVYHMPI